MDGKQTVKASSVSPELSRRNLEQRFWSAGRRTATIRGKPAQGRAPTIAADLAAATIRFRSPRAQSAQPQRRVSTGSTPVVLRAGR